MNSNNFPLGMTNFNPLMNDGLGQNNNFGQNNGLSTNNDFGQNNGLGHHADRCHNVPGEKMDWHVHQEIHNQEKIALNDLGLPGNAFDKAYGNIMNPNNLPPRRQYGNIPGKVY